MKKWSSSAEFWLLNNPHTKPDITNNCEYCIIDNFLIIDDYFIAISDYAHDVALK